MSSISLLVASPLTLVSDLLQQRLAAEPGTLCLGVVHSLRDLEAAVARKRPDVVVVDAVLCTDEATGFIATILEQNPGLVFVLLYDEDHVEMAVRCLTAGVNACVSKHCSFDKFMASVRAAARKEAVVPAQLLSILMKHVREQRLPGGDSRQPALSVRETAILDLVAQGATNAEIAERLALSQQTVKNTLTRLFRHLGVANRAQAAAWWQEHSRESRMDSA